MANAGPCPSPEQLEHFLGEALDDAARTTLETHVETCVDCQQRLERLTASTTPQLHSPADMSLSDTRAAPGPDEEFLARLRDQPPSEPDDRAPSPAPREDSLPPSLGPYEILGHLGQGGMGAVYKARHRELDKIVALKVLPADRVDEAGVSRFRTEMKAAGRMSHPNVVAAHDAGRAGGIYFLAMEFVDGLDLSKLVDRCGPLPVPDACELGRQASVGLRHAHERGLIHRDVKPSNLMLAAGGLVKVLDLGLARLPAASPHADAVTFTGMILGTADYIAPEQIDRAHAVDGRADVYSLGAVLYFLLAGEPPFGGDQYRSWVAKLQGHQHEPVPSLHARRPDIPTPVVALIEKMLAKDPADRPGVADVAEELRPFAAGADLRGLLQAAGTVSDQAHPDPRAETASPRDTRNGAPRSPHPGKRNRTLSVLAGLAGAIVVGGLLWRPFGSGPEPNVPTPPDPARILSVEVRQLRGDSPIGLIGVDRQTIQTGDALRISMKLHAAAYGYLVAFNPDGREQLCYPEAGTEDQARTTEPRKIAELQFPQDGSHYFQLDRAGTQALVFVATSRPLPPYGEWRSRAGTVPWTIDPADTSGVWRYDGQTWTELVGRDDVRPVPLAASKLKLPDFMKKRSGGGQVTKLGKMVPRALDDLGVFFRGRDEFDAVQMIAFPVFRAPE